MSTEYLKLTENKAQTAHPGAARRAKFAKSQLEVRMFNVGEGEAILIAFPNRRAWLVVLLERWLQAVRAPPPPRCARPSEVANLAYFAASRLT